MTAPSNRRMPVVLMLGALCAITGVAVAQPLAPPVGGTASMPPTTRQLLPRPAPPPGPLPGALLPTILPPSADRGRQRTFSQGWISHQNPRPAGPVVVPELPDFEPFIDRHVLGADDREWVWNTAEYPYSAIVKLHMQKDGEWSSCTGFVVQPHFVMTASHCLFNYEDQLWADEIIIIPALSGIFEWFGRWDWERAWARSEWMEARRFSYDMGVIQVRGDIAAQTGSFGTAVIDDEATFDAWFETAGYPTSNPEIMHTGTCQADPAYVHPYQMHYFCDTERGQSGSPVWTTVDDDPYVAVAVNTYDSRDEPLYNGATRLHDEIHAWYAEIAGLCDAACTYGACRGDDEICGFDGTCGAWMPGQCDDGYTCIESECTCVADDMEPDDDAEQSHVLRFGEPLTARVCIDDDDWFQFELAAGQTAIIETRFIHLEGDLEMDLIDEAGEVVEAIATASDDERHEFTADVDGRWFVRVWGFRGASANYVIELIDPASLPPADAGIADHGMPDASAPDAAPDGPAPDAGPPLVDGAMPDSAPVDATPLDATAEDPMPDARPAPLDTSPPPDGPMPDAAADAAISDAETPAADGGSAEDDTEPTGCAAAPASHDGTPGPFMLALMICVVARSRRGGAGDAVG